MKDKEIIFAQTMMADCKALREEIEEKISTLFDDVEQVITDAYIAGYSHAKNNP